MGRLKGTREKNADIALCLYKQGKAPKEIAAIMGKARTTVVRYLTYYHDVTLPRKGKGAYNKPYLCDRCKGKPTKRDRGGLTKVFDHEKETYVWLCAACLVPDIPMPTAVEKAQEMSISATHSYVNHSLKNK